MSSEPRSGPTGRVSALPWLGFLLLACGTQPPDGMVRMVLPAGDADAGQRVFVQLECAACHRVSGAAGLADPAHAYEGVPDLGRSLAGQSRGQIASSIVAPAHVDSRRVELWGEWTGSQRVWLGPGPVPAPEPPEPRRTLRMQDYRSAMTIEQLSDLVAFLERSAR